MQKISNVHKDPMPDRIIEMIESPDARQRVLIVQRTDGRYSFRKQFRSGDGGDDPGNFVGANEAKDGLDGRPQARMSACTTAPKRPSGRRWERSSGWLRPSAQIERSGRLRTASQKPL